MRLFGDTAQTTLVNVENGRIIDMKNGENKPPVRAEYKSLWTELVARLNNLLAAIHPCFQVDVVAALRFARIAVLNPVCCRQGMVGPAHVALGRAGFLLWYCHLGASKLFRMLVSR